MNSFSKIVNQDSYTKLDLIKLLNADEEDRIMLYQKSRAITDLYIGNKVHLRGLIEYSNVCVKDCLYCGIRKLNKKIERYTLSDEDVIKCARYALENNYGSIVLQAGERTDKHFISKITRLLKEIKKISNGKLGITLSLGEQSFTTYKEWFDAGAHRYFVKTIFPFFASAVIVSPSRKVPARISMLSGSSRSRWMARLSGRAPYTGS